MTNLQGDCARPVAWSRQLSFSLTTTRSKTRMGSAPSFRRLLWLNWVLQYFTMFAISTAAATSTRSRCRLKTSNEQSNIGRRRSAGNLRASAASLDEFLSQLQLEASVEPVTEKNLTRVTQLVNKTNQFNVTTRRYTEAQVRARAQDPQGWAGAFHMSDRMGSYGLIGVLFSHPRFGSRWNGRSIPG